MRSYQVVILVLAAASAYAFQPSRLTVVGGLGESSRRALTAEGVSYSKDGPSLIVHYRRSDAVVRALCRSYETLTLAKSVVEQNIACRDISKTADGSPYRRQTLVLDPDGRPQEVSTVEEDLNWVFDPNHPDALRKGDHRGYVARPNVHLEAERQALAQIAGEQKVIRELVERLAPGTVFFSEGGYGNPPTYAPAVHPDGRPD